MSTILERANKEGLIAGGVGDPPVTGPPGGGDDGVGGEGGGVRLTFFATRRCVEAICRGTDFAPEDLRADPTLTPNHQFDSRANRALIMYEKIVDRAARRGSVLEIQSEGQTYRLVFTKE